MTKYNSLADWIESQSLNPYVVLCLSLDGEVDYIEDFITLSEAQNEMTSLWRMCYCNDDERNDYELEILSNGFISCGHRYLLFSAVNTWRVAHE